MTDTFWKIEESVGEHYFTWEGIYSTREAAEQAIERVSINPLNARAVLYQTGGWPSHGNNGPVRCEPVDNPL